MPVISVGQIQITTRTIVHWKHSMSEAIYHPWDPDPYEHLCASETALNRFT